MSKLGFDKILLKLDRLEGRFIVGGIELAKKEFKKNFDTESEDGSSWEPVLRKVPPPILVETGKLKSQASKSGHLKLFKGGGTYTIDPIDRRGRGYAKYHQDGIGRVGARPFVTQSNDLDLKQLTLLYKLLNITFG